MAVYKPKHIVSGDDQTADLDSADADTYDYYFFENQDQLLYRAVYSVKKAPDNGAFQIAFKVVIKPLLAIRNRTRYQFGLHCSPLKTLLAN